MSTTDLSDRNCHIYVLTHGLYSVEKRLISSYKCTTNKRIDCDRHWVNIWVTSSGSSTGMHLMCQQCSQSINNCWNCPDGIHLKNCLEFGSFHFFSSSEHHSTYKVGLNECDLLPACSRIPEIFSSHFSQFYSSVI